jgi:predicted transposase YdaD
VDTLVEVRLKAGQTKWLLVHVEIQAQPDQQFALRMWVYHYRIWDRYQRPVVSLAVLADGDPDWRPGPYHTEFAGCIEHFEYPTCKVLDCVDPEGEFERTGNVFALLVAAHQVALRTRQDLLARSAGRFGIVKHLYKRGLKREQVVSLFRLIEWLTLLPDDLELKFQQDVADYEQTEAVMTAETLLAPIELIALERGRREGQQEGWQKGQQEGWQKGQPVTRTEELAQEPMKTLQDKCGSLEARLRSKLGRPS